MDKRDHARALAELGLRVFPLPRNSKYPPPEGWRESATSDVETVERMWNADPHANIGVATGDGILVLDFDVANGKLGAQSLELMEMAGLPESMRVRTPSGGSHVYLATPPGFEYTVAAERVVHGRRISPLPNYPGVDVRGTGGYVVGPGSTTPEGEYVIVG